ALSVDANDEQIGAIIEALKPDMLQLHGRETPDRVVTVRTRFGLPVMKALPLEKRDDLSPVRLYDKVADRLIFYARAPPEATRAARGDTAGRARQEFRLEVARDLQGRYAVHAVGRARRRQRCRGASYHRRVRGRCLLRCRARRWRKGPRQDPRLHRCRARRREHARRCAGDREARMTVQQLNSFRTGPDDRGHFGLYGGRFVAEPLLPLLLDPQTALAPAQP